VTDTSPRVGPRLVEPLRLLAVALQFLTRLPVPAIRVDDGDLRRATAAFPLVGAVVAAVVIATRAAAEPLLGPVVGTVLAVAAAVAVTGAFHEDGLADTFDGVWGGWTPQRRIEIMRDSRVGTYGAAALVLSLGLRVALLSGLDLGTFVRAVLAGHVVGRAAVLVQIRCLRPVSDQGQGAQVAEPVGPAGVAVAVVTTGVVLVATLGVWAPVPLVLGLVGVGALRRLARRRLGGLTGDVLGATQQVVLVLVLAGVAALSNLGVLP
jgi:adenosylcobinamide-GDP ribazoletransferase